MTILRPYIEAGDLLVASEQYDIKEVSTLRWDRMIAKSRMTSLLNLYYQDKSPDAILSPYDGISRGVIDALKESGYGSHNLPIVTGQDAESTSVRSIIEEEQDMTVFKDIRALAAEAAELAEQILTDTMDVEAYATLYNGKVQVPSKFLEPVSVDRHNWEEVLVESGYYTREEIIE